MQIIATRRKRVAFPDDLFPFPTIEAGKKVLVHGVIVDSKAPGRVVLTDAGTTSNVFLDISGDFDHNKVIPVNFIANKGVTILLPFADIRVVVLYSLVV